MPPIAKMSTVVSSATQSRVRKNGMIAMAMMPTMTQLRLTRVLKIAISRE